ncbi:MAG: addiction module toxin, HicA family [Symploca sp. SIO1C4]|uniref:Addiction module toxin, HicA family n=1 Tax=Symploca sp. SIO1C4 TaxID=2607765 RepID=A0A6B3NQB4_9CYAN|nr:addiction module toxin, HicA family [Symploca sp. SIO1C4]
MPKQQTLTAREAEQLLLKAGFAHIQSKGSHRIYLKGTHRVVVPFHGKKVLHPKIVKQVLVAIEK